MITFKTMKDVEDWQFKPYEDKLKIAHATIQEALAQSRRQAVAFSGGKNSLVVLHLVLQYKPDVVVAFNNTTAEYPETVKYVRWLAKEWNLNFYEVKPEMTFWQCVKKYGFPTLRSWKRQGIAEPPCCRYLKTEPVSKFYNKKAIDCFFTGITAFESRYRKIRIVDSGLMPIVKHVGHDGKLNRPTLSVKPIGLWDEIDVWKYIDENNLPVNPAYEKYGVGRTGCRWCTGHIGWQKRIARDNPRMLRKILRMMGQSNLEDYEV